MAPKLWMCGTAGALSLAAMIGAAQSAPLGSAVDRFGPATAIESNLERVQYRLCVTEGGSRQCRSVEIYGPGQLGYQAPGPGYRAPGPVYGYQAPGPVYGYQAPGAVYGYQAPGPVYGYQAPGPAYGYQGPGPVYGYQAPGAAYGYGPAGSVYGYRRAYVLGYTDPYVSPDAYPAGSPPWWQSMDKIGRGGSH